MNKVHVYTDGSYNQQTNEGGWGFVYLKDQVTAAKGPTDVLAMGCCGPIVCELEALGQAVNHLVSQGLQADEAIIHCDCLPAISIIETVRKDPNAVSRFKWASAKMKEVIVAVAKSLFSIAYEHSGKSPTCFHGLAHCLAAQSTHIKLKAQALMLFQQAFINKSLKIDGQVYCVQTLA